MRSLKRALEVGGAFLTVLLACMSYGAAQTASLTHTTIHTFTGAPGDGSGGFGNLAIGGGGVLYGTTLTGGTSDAGTVFSLTPPASPGGLWTEAVLYNFAGGSDGSKPTAGVTIGSGGVLYGTTSYGGASNMGTVFSLTPPAAPAGVWTESVLYAFAGSHDGGSPDGAIPYGGVAIGAGGVLYGTTFVGGTKGWGTVFSLTPPTSPGGTWTKHTRHNFAAGNDGASPYSGVVIGSGGVLYGTTSEGNPVRENGVVYSLTPPATPGGAWTEAILHDFGNDGDGNSPFAGVAIGSDGVLYGTTFTGAVYSLTPPSSPGGAWTEAVLYTFAGGSDGQYPEAGVLIGPRGELYGTTSAGGYPGNFGTVFMLAPPASAGGSWTETVLHRFTGSDGAYPYAGVALGTDGLYGITTAGGTSGDGTAFWLTR